MFPGESGAKLNDITDGTSCTIMTIEGDDSNAVIWTKPDDWDVEIQLPKVRNRELIVGWADGSVRRLRPGIKPEVLRALLSTRGGEVIDFNEL